MQKVMDRSHIFRSDAFCCRLCVSGVHCRCAGLSLIHILYNVLKDGQKGRNNFLVTVIQGNGTGSRYFLADGEVKAQCGSGDIETERLRELVQPGESGIAEADGRRLFVESLKQPAHLVTCGAGHVACLLYTSKGVFEVVGVHHNTMEEKKILEYAALAESFSSHPISRSLKTAYGKEIDRQLSLIHI